jgi:ABC-type molybdate transport system substrate-binding protein
MTRKTLVVGALVAALLLGACGSDKKASTTGSTPKAGGLVVNTVASLKTVVTSIVTAYNKNHPRAPFRVVVETQAVMKKAVATSKPQIAIDGNALRVLVKGAKKGSVGRNVAVIAVSTSNPHHVTNLNAFAATSGLKTKVCGAKSVIGNFSALVLGKAKIKPNPATVAFDCEAKALADVAANRLDAVLMYRADHAVPSGVTLVTVPDAQNITIPISYAVIGGTSGPRFVFEKYLSSPAARAILTRAGYLP